MMRAKLVALAFLAAGCVPMAPPDVPVRDTREVLERIRAGRLRPRTSFDISHAIVSTLTRRMETSGQFWPSASRPTTRHEFCEPGSTG